MQRMVHSNRSGASELAMERLKVLLVSDEDLLDVLRAFPIEQDEDERVP